MVYCVRYEAGRDSDAVRDAGDDLPGPVPLAVRAFPTFPLRPFLSNGGKPRLCVLGRHYAVDMHRR